MSFKATNLRNAGKQSLALLVACAAALAFAIVGTLIPAGQAAYAVDGDLFSPHISVTNTRYVNVFVRQPVAGQTVQDVCSWGEETMASTGEIYGETSFDVATQPGYVLHIREGWFDMTAGERMSIDETDKFIAGHRYRYVAFMQLRNESSPRIYSIVETGQYNVRFCMPNHDDVAWQSVDTGAKNAAGQWTGEYAYFEEESDHYEFPDWQWAFAATVECASPMSGMSDMGTLNVDLSSYGFWVCNGNDAERAALLNTLQILKANGVVALKSGTSDAGNNAQLIDLDRRNVAWVELIDDGSFKALVATSGNKNGCSFTIPKASQKPASSLLAGTSYYSTLNIVTPKSTPNPDHGTFAQTLTKNGYTLDANMNLMFYAWLNAVKDDLRTAGYMTGGMRVDLDGKGSYDFLYRLNTADGTGTISLLPTCSLSGSYSRSLTSAQMSRAKAGDWPFYSTFNASVLWQTGWYRVGDMYYYVTSNSGTLANGWLKVGGKWYYFSPSSKVMQTGWLRHNGNWFYLAPKKLSSSRPEGSMITGWLKIDGKWYLFNSGGAMQTKWRNIGGKWYYFKEKGDMATGWLKYGGKWYYLAPETLSSSRPQGAMVTGWLKLGGNYYYFKSGGSMHIGWLKSGGKYYYFKSNGQMATGTMYINGKVYKFSSSGVWLG